MKHLLSTRWLAIPEHSSSAKQLLQMFPTKCGLDHSSFNVTLTTLQFELFG